MPTVVRSSMIVHFTTVARLAAALAFVFSMSAISAGASLVVGPGPGADFADLPSAWSYAITSRRNVTIQLQGGTHLLPFDSGQLLAVPADNPPISITHQPVAPYSWPETGFPSAQSLFSSVAIAPNIARSGQNGTAGAVFQLQGPISLSFRGITVFGFPAPTRSTTSTWSVFEVNSLSSLSLTEAFIRDNGTAAASFVAIGKGSGRISFSNVAVVSNDVLWTEIRAFEDSSVTISGSQFSNLTAWRDTIVGTHGASTLSVVDSSFNQNRNMAFAIRDASLAQFTRSSFTRNTSPMISNQATVMLVNGATALYDRCTFTGNSGGQTGAVSFIHGRGLFRDTEISGNSGAAIMSLRCAGSSVVDLTRCTISNHVGTSRIVQISETARVSISDSEISGNSQGWVAGVYMASSLRVRNTVVKDNVFPGPSAFYVAQGIRAELNGMQFSNNRAATYLVVADRASALNVTSSRFSGNVIESGGLVQSYGESVLVSNSTFTSNTVSARSPNDRLLNLMGTFAGASFTINQSTFTSNSVAQVIGFGNSQASNSVQNCNIFKNSAVSISSTDNVPIAISNSNFTNNLATEASAVVARGSVEVAGSVFTRNVGAVMGGALLFAPATPGSSSLAITNSVFRNNVATRDGGAIYIKEVVPTQAQLVGNTFERNEAGRGGAVYVFSSATPVKLDGGNKYIDNVALKHQGPNFASEPVRLDARVLDEQSKQLADMEVLMLNSGESVPSFRVVPTDHYGQDVHSMPDETFLLHYQVVGKVDNEGDGAVTPTTDALLDGEVYKAILEEWVAFQNVRLIAAPGVYMIAVSSVTERHPSSVFNVTSVIVVPQCSSPRIEVPYSTLQRGALPVGAALSSTQAQSSLTSAGKPLSVCKSPVCSKGCIQGQGSCVADNVCHCAAGFEGTDCGLRKGFNDAVTLSFMITSVDEHVEDAVSVSGSTATRLAGLASAAGAQFSDPVSADSIYDPPFVSQTSHAANHDPNTRSDRLMSFADVPEPVVVPMLSRRSASVTQTAGSVIDGALRTTIGSQLVSLLAAQGGSATPVLRNIDILRSTGAVKVNISLQTVSGSFLELADLESAASDISVALAKRPNLMALVTIPNPANISESIVSSLALRWTDATLAPSPKFFIAVDSPLGVISLTVFAGLVLTTLVVMSVLTRYRATPVVRSSSYFFGMLICNGVIMGYLIIPLSIGIPTQQTCSAQAWAAAISVSMVLGNLMTKTLRIMFIFAGGRKGRLVGLADRDMLRYSAAVLLIQIILMGLWTSLDPPVPTIVDGQTERYWACGSVNGSSAGNHGNVFLALILSYNAALLMFSVYLAIRTRGAQSAYRESKSIGIGVYAITLISGICIPILLLPSTGPVVGFVLKTGAICTVNAMVTYLLYFSKVYIAVYRPDLNNMEALNNRGSAFSRQSQSNKDSQIASRRGNNETPMAKQAFQARRVTRQGTSFVEAAARRAAAGTAQRGRTGTGANGAANISSALGGGTTARPVSVAIAGVEKTARLDLKLPSSNQLMSFPGQDIRDMMSSAASRARHGSNGPSSLEGGSVHAQSGSETTSQEDVSGSVGTVVSSSIDAINAKAGTSDSSSPGSPPAAILAAVHEHDPTAAVDANPITSMVEPQKELFQVRFPSVRRASFQQRWIHIYPLTDHLVISKAPVPAEATVLYLNQCRVRNLSAAVRNCFEIEVNGESYWFRTRQDAVFRQWFGWLAHLCLRQSTAIGDLGSDENIFESNDSTIAGSFPALSGGKKREQQLP